MNTATNQSRGSQTLHGERRLYKWRLASYNCRKLTGLRPFLLVLKIVACVGSVLLWAVSCEDCCVGEVEDALREPDRSHPAGYAQDRLAGNLEGKGKFWFMVLTHLRGRVVANVAGLCFVLSRAVCRDDSCVGEVEDALRDSDGLHPVGYAQDRFAGNFEGKGKFWFMAPTHLLCEVEDAPRESYRSNHVVQALDRFAGISEGKGKF